MNDTLKHLITKFNLDLTQKSPIEIPDFGRDGLAELFNELNFKAGVEIGVCDGVYSEILCKANPEAKIYGVDPFVPYRWYRDYTREGTIQKYKRDALERMSKYPNYTLIEKYSTDAVNDFKDNSLDFVYIDGNHEFSYVANDISLWSRKVRPGGIISGHDYLKRKQPTQTHVYQIVHAYTDAYEIKPWFVLGSQAKYEGLIRDDARSWMWVK